MSDIAAKARRAAEWFKEHTQDKCFAKQDLDGWGIYSRFTLGDGSQRVGMTDGPFSDRMLIAFTEDRGWQDQEADGAEVLSEQQKVGSYLARWGMRKEGSWNWIVLCPPLRAVYGSGTAPTRTEARAAAVKAAAVLAG